MLTLSPTKLELFNLVCSFHHMQEDSYKLKYVKSKSLR